MKSLLVNLKNRTETLIKDIGVEAASSCFQIMTQGMSSPQIHGCTQKGEGWMLHLKCLIVTKS